MVCASASGGRPGLGAFGGPKARAAYHDYIVGVEDRLEPFFAAMNASVYFARFR